MTHIRSFLDSLAWRGTQASLPGGTPDDPGPVRSGSLETLLESREEVMGRLQAAEEIVDFETDWLGGASASPDPSIAREARARLASIAAKVAVSTSVGQPLDVDEPLWMRRILRSDNDGLSRDASARNPMIVGLHLAIMSGLLTWIGLPWVALVFQMSTVGADAGDRELGQTSRRRRPRSNYFGCVSSHAGDYAILGGMALYLLAVDEPAGAVWVTVAIALAAFGSFARMAALSAGVRIQRRTSERLTRVLGIGAGLSWIGLGHPLMAVTMVSVLVGGYGLYELVDAMGQVHRRAAIKIGLVTVRCDDAECERDVEEWGMEPPGEVLAVAVSEVTGLAPSR